MSSAPACWMTRCASLVDKLSERFNTEVVVLRFESVGPTIGSEVTPRAAQAVRLLR